MVLAVVALGAGYARFTGAAPASSLHGASASSPPPAPALRLASVSAQSAELDRLGQRRLLYETVDSLVHAADFERARQLLDEDQARYGEDSAPEWRDLETGYRLIADCLEQPENAKPRTRAQAFVRVSEARVLVPKILAACGSRRQGP